MERLIQTQNSLTFNTGEPLAIYFTNRRTGNGLLSATIAAEVRSLDPVRGLSVQALTGEAHILSWADMAHIQEILAVWARAIAIRDFDKKVARILERPAQEVRAMLEMLDTPKPQVEDLPGDVGDITAHPLIARAYRYLTSPS